MGGSNFEDLTGQTFGMLTVIRRVDDHIYKSGGHRVVWECRCQCGAMVNVYANNLKTGNTRSCGCLEIDLSRKRFLKHGCSHNNKLYKIWQGMKRRCNCPRCERYPHYGGKGIKVCDEWANNFSAFKSWAEQNGYLQGLSIERIDIDKDYCPENCTWIPMSEQARNTSQNHYITINGETKILSDWCKEYSINITTVLTRIRLGWSEIDAITVPVKKAATG